jgi:hypothetical protein
MIRGHVVEITPEKKLRNRGDYEFVSLPFAGDRLVLGTEQGDLEMVRVVRTKHVPVHVPPAKHEGHAPIARIYVEWVEKWNDED